MQRYRMLLFFVIDLKTFPVSFVALTAFIAETEFCSCSCIYGRVKIHETVLVLDFVLK